MQRKTVVVDEETAGTFGAWTDAEPLRSLTPVLRGADRLRTSLVPSLLAVRRTNEALSNPEIELFEIAKVYLPRAEKLPDDIKIEYRYAGEGTFWTDARGKFSDLAARKILSQKKNKPEKK